GLADQVAWQNLKEFRAGARISLRRNWTVAGVYNDWWLASATDAFYNSSGSIVARDPKGLSGTHIGEEYDAETTYRFNRDLEFGTGIGHILPGGFLAKTIKGKPYTYPYVMLNYNFF
ncbi:MAG TPA: alginate export family protein, partial [Bryobacteraceae bacterium]|nr:alginate export family protein [Bryobacteraceae bacterium]